MRQGFTRVGGDAIGKCASNNVHNFIAQFNGQFFRHAVRTDDRNVRIAPTFGSLEELAGAMQILTLCVKLASARLLLAQP